MIDEASIGGGQQHVLWLAERIDKSKFDVAVACEREGYLVDELRKKTIPHFPVEMSNTPGFRSLLACRKILRDYAPDILHTHGGTAGFYGRISAKLAGINSTIHTYHGIHYLNFERRIAKYAFTWIDRLLLHITDWILCVAQNDFQIGMKAHVVKRSKSSVIHNGIDVDKYQTSEKRQYYREMKSGLVVGAVGRLHVQKGHSYLLKAARQVIDRYSATEFVIIGDGELREYLKEQREKLDLQRHVRFIGSQTDIRSHLAEMDVFVLPSLWEGFPIVLLEAMAGRIPIVATRVNGVTEILRDGRDALLVSPKNPVELAQAIITFIEHPELRESLAENAFRKVRMQFHVDDMVRKIEQVYEHVLRQHKIASIG